jgi:hypothetical protein
VTCSHSYVDGALADDLRKGTDQAELDASQRQPVNAILIVQVFARKTHRHPATFYQFFREAIGAERVSRAGKDAQGYSRRAAKLVPEIGGMLARILAEMQGFGAWG